MQIFDDTRAAGETTRAGRQKMAPLHKRLLAHRRIAPKDKDLAIPSLWNGEVLGVQKSCSLIAFTKPKDGSCRQFLSQTKERPEARLSSARACAPAVAGCVPAARPARTFPWAGKCRRGVHAHRS